ncbi:hypothetical protein [Bradyrhizobium sp. OAE829]|uniref:hypothetical protein n=1 Tax=Bradyrhizobium sp. OAE829 TaxID=2663807 RepID=UPI00178AF9F8
MQEYRAYTIGSDGHIQQRFDLTATDEATAREQAKRLVDGHDVELWQGTVKVAKFTRKH